MNFVLVPAGNFIMGSEEAPESFARDYPRYDLQRFIALKDEAPAHQVRITRSFYLGQHEVTAGQFRRFVEASGYRSEAETDGTGGYGYDPDYRPETTVRRDAFRGRDPRYSWRDPGFAQGDDHPVVNVTWNDAVALAAWLSEMEGRSYRLPTEAEWEYACRAGVRTRYSSGDDPSALSTVANLFDADAAPLWPHWERYAQPGHDGFVFTAPVGSYAPNAFGVYDMHGNVWEWVADWYAEDYYAHSPVDDPPGPMSGQLRARRGGSWHSWALYARCAMRNLNTPQSRYLLLGIRLAIDVGPP
jgi:formylglycine-generating enzyme required for sulfatase activity